MKEQLTLLYFSRYQKGILRSSKSCQEQIARDDTLEEARTNLQEVVQLVLESNRAFTEKSLRGSI
jgi:hypothetical protein